ncbi:MAG: SUF system Fe-S cluster assembly protein [Proteobacteria bacterium]|nr:SUF system Fe-S cluster assembly protein [Pseudomonadota bacterium]
MTKDKTKKSQRPVYAKDQGEEYLGAFLKGGAGANKELGKEEEHKEGTLRERVIDALCQIYDPEIPVNIYDLGLIYDVNVDDNGNVEINMTLTTPNCPVAETMPNEVEMRALYVDGVQDAKVNLVWDPPWDPSKMSEAAQLELGFL